MAKDKSQPDVIKKTVVSGGAEVTHQYIPGDTAPASSRRPAWARFNPLKPLRRVSRTRWWPYLALVGPGIIAGSAGNDAGGIATYASTGAAYGYSLLWAMLVVTFCFAL